MADRVWLEENDRKIAQAVGVSLGVERISPSPERWWDNEQIPNLCGAWSECGKNETEPPSCW